MNETEIKKLVAELLAQVAPDADPSILLPDDDIRRKLDIDSFDYLQFIVALSKKNGKDIPEKDYGKINTLRKMGEYLKA